MEDNYLGLAPFIFEMSPKSEKCMNLCSLYISMEGKIHILFTLWTQASFTELLEFEITVPITEVNFYDVSDVQATQAHTLRTSSVRLLTNKQQ